MGKSRKIKKLVGRAEHAADRAEAAYQRMVELSAPGQGAGDSRDGSGQRDSAGSGRPAIYTSPAGEDSTPPAAQVP